LEPCTEVARGSVVFTPGAMGEEEGGDVQAKEWRAAVVIIVESSVNAELLAKQCRCQL